MKANNVYLLLALLLTIDAVRSEKIIVHLIPHSHCDPGWLQTYQVLSYNFKFNLSDYLPQAIL